MKKVELKQILPPTHNDHFTIVKSTVDLSIGMFVVHTAVTVPLEENMETTLSFEMFESYYHFSYHNEMKTQQIVHYESWELWTMYQVSFTGLLPLTQLTLKWHKSADIFPELQH